MKDWKVIWNNKGRNYFNNFQNEFPKKTWYDNVPYINIRFITFIIRMRLGHCLMGKPLFRIRFRETPLCECGGLEDPEHFLFECSIRRNQGKDLYHEFIKWGIPSPPNVNTILSLNNRIKYRNYWSKFKSRFKKYPSPAPKKTLSNPILGVKTRQLLGMWKASLLPWCVKSLTFIVIFNTTL